jgi:peptide/nickel transport system permease protein
MNVFSAYGTKLVKRAQMAINDHDAAKAHALANKALKLDSSLVGAWLILAATSSSEESVQYLEHVLSLDPSNTKAQKGLVWAKRNNAGKSEGDHTAKPLLLDNIGKIINKNPDFQIKDQSSQRQVFLKNSFGWQSVFVFLCILILATVSIFAPVIAPLEEEQASVYFKDVCERLRCRPEPPNEERILGTIKEFDVFHTLIWGTRQAMKFGLSAALLAALIGTLLGAAAAFTGGLIDQVIMRVCDALLAFPLIAAVALFIQVIAQLTPTSYGLSLAQFDAIPEELNFFQNLLMNSDPVFLALVLFSWMPYARIMHAQILRIKQTDYVDAATVLGAKRPRIIFLHILPNSISPCVVTTARDVGRMVVLQASFTFIGVGSSSSWSTLLNIGKDWIIGPSGNLLAHWWVYLPITAAILFFGISWSMLGDVINHTINPKNA